MDEGMDKEMGRRDGRGDGEEGWTRRWGGGWMRRWGGGIGAVTHDTVHSSPLLVASPTGYVISTPSSIHTGMSGRAKNPNVHSEKAMFTDWCSSLATCKHKDDPTFKHKDDLLKR